MTALAHGTLAAGQVVVHDAMQAKRLHAKSLAGVLQAGLPLRLSLAEAAYCMGAGWLAVEGAASPAALLSRAQDPRRALTDALVYRDLRSRGYVARHAAGEGRFDVWPRGANEGPVQFQALACSGGDPVHAADLASAAPGLVCSVVDEDSNVTHYEVAPEAPRGEVNWADLPGAGGTVVADRIQVTDPAAVAAYAKAFLGTPTDGGVFLSPLEAEALRRRGLLRVPSPLPVPEAHLRAYEALRGADVVPKSGFRFGAHLRAYRGDPDASHADWLVHCAGDAPLAWSDLSRGVRLAHGVKKQFLVTVPSGQRISFVRIGWFRP